VRRLGLGFAPQFQLIKVFRWYLPLRDPIDQVLPETRWKIGPPNSSASITECHPRKFFFQSLPFGSVSRFRKSLHEGKEALFLSFFGLKTGLDQIDEHTIGARLPRLGQRAHTLGDPGRNRHALPN